jgi:hypothetical protein
MANIPNRRERRAAMKHAGILKQKSKLSYKKWLEVTRENIRQGKEIHAANVDAMEKSKIAQLEEMESKAISGWKEAGYNSKEIELLREAWALTTVRDKESWQEDKKEAKEIRAKVEEMKKSRA